MKEFQNRFYMKLKKKGNLGFNSGTEVFGKLIEEVGEAWAEVHNKDNEKLATELLDCAIVAIFGISSLKANGSVK